MNKLKKLLKPLLLIFVIIAACVAAFSACGGGEEPEQIDADWDHTAGSWRETDGVYFGLVGADDAPEGEIIAENVKAGLTMEIGKKYYYIIDFILQAAENNSGWEQLKVSVKLNAETALSADLEETSSSYFTNEVNGDEREIAVTYTVPDYAEVQIKKRIVLGLSAKLGGEVGAKVSFTSGVELAGLPKTASDNLTVGYTQGLKYEESDGGYTVYRGAATDNDVIIPYVKDGKYITAIGNAAFKGFHYLSTISIPDSVVHIWASAFENCSLTGIALPESVTYIGDYAFSGCGYLSDIAIPDKVTYLGNYVFRDCGRLTELTVPNGVKRIWEGAFSGCDALAKITIGDGVTRIDGAAFYGCGSLADISLPDGLTAVGDDVFYGCDSLNYSEYGNALYLGNGDNKYVVLVKAADENIASCNIHAKAKIIYDYAFGGCGKLTDIEIPDGVACIGKRVFNSCVRLAGITVGKNNKVYKSEDNCVLTKDGNELVLGCKTSVIPNGVKSIESFAFYGCTELKNIVVPISVTSIGESVFGYCNKLESITLPFIGASLSNTENYPLGYIFEKVFLGEATSNNSYNIPEALQCVTVTGGKILSNAFVGCGKLTEIIISDGVDSIVSGAFSGCNKLASITLPFAGSVYALKSDNFFGSIFVAGKGSDSYSYVPKTLKTVVITGGGSIANAAFANCSGITDVTIGDGVTSIGNYAFANCKNLRNAAISKSVTDIGASVFDGCVSLENITVESGNTAYVSQDGILYNFEKSLFVHVPQAVKGNVNIPDGMTLIGGFAFMGCGNLTGITIPVSVTTICDFAFMACDSLTDITFKGTKAQWDAINKGTGWNNNTGEYTVHCTDGDLSKE